MQLTARQIAADCDGEILSGPADARVTSFAIDSRTVAGGECFVALEAERDGHEFVGDAVARGASAALVRRAVTVPGDGAALILVREPLEALAAVARRARERRDDLVVVGITGSAGKTATKDLTAAALGGSVRVHASPASFNNEAGLPLTLLGAPDDTEVLVAEMGARFAGNIRDLADIARPTVGVVTHVGWAHAEHLGGRAGIAAVKGELVDSLPADGLAVLNAGCDATPALAARTSARVVTVGRAPAQADVVVDRVELDDELRPRFGLTTPWGSCAVRLELRGEHQVENAAMAATVALHLGVPLDAVAAGLARARGAAQRMELRRATDGVVVVNDAYNSSPSAAVAAVRSLAGLRVEGRRIAVLGEMLELGADAASGQAAVGEAVAAGELDVLVVVGGTLDALIDAASSPRLTTHRVDDPEGAIALLLHEVRPGDAVLVKASRAIGLEQVAEALLDREPAS